MSSYFHRRTNVVDFHKQISNDTELSIKLELMNKVSEKDISKRFNVSHNKVNRIMHELSRKTVLPGILPTIMNFDKFKATKDTVGKMAFIITDTKKHKTFDILESRKSNYLKKYFYRFPRKQRLAVNLLSLIYLVLIMIYLNLSFLMLPLYPIDFTLLLKLAIPLNVPEFKL